MHPALLMRSHTLECFPLKKAKTKDKQKPAAIGASKFQAVPFPKQERPREAECRVRHQIGSRQLKFKN